MIDPPRERKKALHEGRYWPKPNAMMDDGASAFVPYGRCAGQDLIDAARLSQLGKRVTRSRGNAEGLSQ
jgi:hypothetical protein